MLYIDSSRLSPSDAWLAKAEGALELMFDVGTKEERREILRLKARLWSLIKRDLESLSFGKCWYCEARQIRSRMAVDHFRPKNNVKNVNPEHDGYWWLAFDVSNYRLSCTFCNSLVKDEDGTTRGKQDLFPLLDESARARTPDDDLELEKPTLLDPLVQPTLHFFSLTQTVTSILTLGFVQKGRDGSSELAPPSMSTT